MDTIAFTETELKDLDLNILTAIKNIRKNNQRADVANVHHEVVKIINFEQTSQTVIDERLKLLLEDGQISNKINRNKDSFRLNKQLLDASPIDFLPSTQRTPSFVDTPCTFFQEFSSKDTSVDHELEHICDEIDQSERFIDCKFKELEIISLKSTILKELNEKITEIVRNEIKNHCQFKATIKEDKCIEHENEIKLLKEQLYSKDLIIKSLTESIKEISTAKRQKQNIEAIPHFSFNTVSSSVTDEAGDKMLNSLCIESNIDGNSDMNHEEFKKEILQRKMLNQLEQVKKKKKEEFYYQKNCNLDSSSAVNRNNESIENHNKKNNIIIAGDSIINGILEEKMSREDSTVKVHKFPGANVDSMRKNLIPIITKNTSHLILHVATNDATTSPSRHLPVQSQ